MENYYKNQLSKLNLDQEYTTSLKIFDGHGKSTNQMDLNTESIPVLIEFLKSLRDTLNKDTNYCTIESCNCKGKTV